MNSKRIKIRKFREKRDWIEEREYKKELKSRIHRREKFYSKEYNDDRG